MAAEVMKVELEMETCCVCGGGGELLSPEEHDAGAPPMQVPLRTMLVHLNSSKVQYFGSSKQFHNLYFMLGGNHQSTLALWWFPPYSTVLFIRLLLLKPDQTILNKNYPLKNKSWVCRYYLSIYNSVLCYGRVYLHIQYFAKV